MMQVSLHCAVRLFRVVQVGVSARDSLLAHEGGILPESMLVVEGYDLCLA